MSLQNINLVLGSSTLKTKKQASSSKSPKEGSAQLSKEEREQRYIDSVLLRKPKLKERKTNQKGSQGSKKAMSQIDFNKLKRRQEKVALQKKAIKKKADKLGKVSKHILNIIKEHL